MSKKDDDREAVKRAFEKGKANKDWGDRPNKDSWIDKALTGEDEDDDDDDDDDGHPSQAARCAVTTRSDASATLVAQLHRLADHISIHDLPAPIITRINTPRFAVSQQSSDVELQLWARTSAEIAEALTCWADTLVDPTCTVRIVINYRASVHIHVTGQIAEGPTVDVMAVDVPHARYSNVEVGETVPVSLDVLRFWVDYDTDEG